MDPWQIILWYVSGESICYYESWIMTRHWNWQLASKRLWFQLEFSPEIISLRVVCPSFQSLTREASSSFFGAHKRDGTRLSLSFGTDVGWGTEVRDALDFRQNFAWSSAQVLLLHHARFTLLSHRVKATVNLSLFRHLHFCKALS